MAKNSETEKALKMNESSSASDIKIKEKPEKNNLKIKINNSGKVVDAKFEKDIPLMKTSDK